MTFLKPEEDPRTIYTVGKWPDQNPNKYPRKIPRATDEAKEEVAKFCFRHDKNI